MFCRHVQEKEEGSKLINTGYMAYVSVDFSFTRLVFLCLHGDFCSINLHTV